MTKKQIYYLASHMLSLDINKDKIHHIVKDFPEEKSSWQLWVYTASNHFILPALYLSLKRSRLLKNLPDDLNEYLKYVYKLNVERNHRIIEQTHDIKRSLDRENIGSVVMKGTGNILDGLYNDPGERMLYDIDLLVKDEDMLSAVEILLGKGYFTQKPFNPKAYPSTMHYPILLKEGCVAGVEIHRKAVHHRYLKYLNTGHIFSSKTMTKGEHPGFYVMSDKHKILHNFLHSQLMHNGHYHGNVSLRDLYDLLLLSQRVNPAKVFDCLDKSYRKKAFIYLKLMYKVFDLPGHELTKSSCPGRWFFFRHDATIKMGKRTTFFYKFIITFIQKYIILPLRVTYNRNTRNYVFSRLGDKKWYKQHLLSYKRKFFKKKRSI